PVRCARWWPRSWCASSGGRCRWSWPAAPAGRPWWIAGPASVRTWCTGWRAPVRWWMWPWAWTSRRWSTCSCAPWPRQVVLPRARHSARWTGRPATGGRLLLGEGHLGQARDLDLVTVCQRDRHLGDAEAIVLAEDLVRGRQPPVVVDHEVAALPVGRGGHVVAGGDVQTHHPVTGRQADRKS